MTCVWGRRQLPAQASAPAAGRPCHHHIDVRYAANPLDYKKLIIPRSFEKDWSPKDPRLVRPRMRQVVAFNNN